MDSLQDLIESMACGIVSDMISPSGLCISSVSSVFFGAFFGAIALC
jgi:hypothetical protein